MNDPRRWTPIRLAGLATIAALVIAQAPAARSAIIISRDMVAGDGSISRLTPGPRYSVLRVPETPLATRYQAEHRIAADFAQVYFPARAPSGEPDGYSVNTPDPWGRPSRYAPFVHWACAVSICGLSYGWAGLLHVWLQYGAFVLSLAYAFRALRIASLFPAAFLAVNIGLFLTPIGISWFERGQFSLYVAAAYLWLLLGMYRERAGNLALAALFGYLKWTSFPMLFVCMAVWLLVAPDRRTFTRRIRLALVPLLVVVSLFAVFPASGMRFLEGLAYQENMLPAEGLSLARVFPRWLVKAIPVALIALGAIRGRFASLEVRELVPFWLGSAMVLLLYPTLAFEYSVPGLFGLIPFALEWGQRRSTSDVLAWLVPGFFFLFIIAASTLMIVDAIANAGIDLGLIWGYLACAALLLAITAGQKSGVRS